MSYPFSYLTGEVGKLGIARIKRRIVVGNNALVYDTFSDADGTLLTAHIPDICPAGAAWLSAGSAFISGNKLTQSHNSVLIVAIDSGVSSGVITVSMDYVNLSSLDGGIIARYIDSTHFWLLRYYLNNLQIYENNNNVYTLRASAIFSSPNGTELLTATLNGNNLTITMLGISVSYSSSLFNIATNHGLRMVSNITTSLTSDNFTVTPL